MKLKVTTLVDAPDGAEYYTGDLLGVHTFYKVTQVGGFDHWWYHVARTGEWVLARHTVPAHLNRITEERIA